MLIPEGLRSARTSCGDLILRWLSIISRKTINCLRRNRRAFRRGELCMVNADANPPSSSRHC